MKHCCYFWFNFARPRKSQLKAASFFSYCSIGSNISTFRKRGKTNFTVWYVVITQIFVIFKKTLAGQNLVAWFHFPGEYRLLSWWRTRKEYRTCTKDKRESWISATHFKSFPPVSWSQVHGTCRKGRVAEIEKVIL